MAKTTKKAPAAKAKRPAKKAAKPAAQANGKKLRQIDAAMRVLAKAGEPMTCKAMVEAMAKQGLWTSPGGATPEATLYSSILRDLRKGKDARFKKKDRGHFTLAGK
jgi:uncharacterized lipoprotein NlpE involved in copper resistance